MKPESTRIRCLEDYQRVYAASLKDGDAFWAAVAQDRVLWRKPWTRVSACDYQTAQVRWFEGAELNVAENCLDRHVQAGRGDHPALEWIGNEPGERRTLTYAELLAKVCQAAHGLEKLGVRKGDRVVLYLPNVPELGVAVLACARIGAVHSVIFGGFSAQSIQSRIQDCGAKVVVTANGTYRGAKYVDLQANVAEALALGCPTVKTVVVLKRSEKHALYEGWMPWEEAFEGSLPKNHTAPAHDSESPLFILYTSGSTGKPKGVLHTMGGYLTYVSYTFDTVFQPKAEDVYWCTADVGWITGHSYLLYGPLAAGITSVMYEGIPTHPHADRFWSEVDALGVTIFYSAPTAIRILAASGDGHVKSHRRATLRTLGTVGEPINPEAWKWYSEVVGEARCPIVDTWWQTETGGILISPIAGITSTKPGSATLPLPGVEPKLLDEKGRELLGAATGALVLARSWPGQMRGVYGDAKRFYETYFTQFKGHYFTGDGARRDEDGYYWVTGRIDDVIQVAGHRLGTAEIESACITHPKVAESAAVGVPDPVTGEALHVFVEIKGGGEGSPALAQELVAVVRKEVGPLATPKKFHFVPGLPKTRSGKIMRRILRKLAQGQFEDLGDTSTLADPTIVERTVAALKRPGS